MYVVLCRIENNEEGAFLFEEGGGRIQRNIKKLEYELSRYFYYGTVVMNERADDGIVLYCKKQKK